MIVYLNGQFLPKEQARISPDDRGFLFGDGVYETVRSFDRHLFRSQAHWQRLAKSLAAIQMNGPTAVEAQSVATTLLDENDLLAGEATIYVQVTRGVAPRKHGFPHCSVPPTVYAFAARFAPPEREWEKGVRVLTVPDQRWGRCDIKAISLLATVLANEQAQSAGAHEAILVRNAVVTEGSHTNFASIRDGVLLTHPATDLILNGITRAAIIELCADLDIPVRQQPVLESELGALDEAMLLGTTNDVMPVVQINDWTIGNGQPGPMTRRLQQAFRELVAREKSCA